MDQITAELIKGQIKKAKEKLSAAKSLHEDGFQDDSISRAYYVMFHAGSAALLSEGIMEIMISIRILIRKMPILQLFRLKNFLWQSKDFFLNIKVYHLRNKMS